MTCRWISRIAAVTVLLWLATSSAEPQTEPQTETPAKPPIEASADSTIEQSRTLRRQLLVQKNTAFAEQTPEQQEASLTLLIEQVLSLQMPSPSATAPSAAETVAETAAAPAVSEETAVSESPSAAAETAAAVAASQKAALEKLDGTVATPYPMQLADVLYRQGRLDLAGRYYEMAMEKADKADVSVYSWLLFQTANCLRQSDPDHARLKYEELIRSYPNSVWAAAAQARHRMMIWLNINSEELKAYDAL